MVSTLRQHTCSLQWCEQSSFGEPHWCSEGYVPASMSPLGPDSISVGGVHFPVVGIGVRYDELQGTPAVYVHLSGGSPHHDVDAYLRLDEAQEVLNLLQGAIDIVRGTVAGEAA